MALQGYIGGANLKNGELTSIVMGGTGACGKPLVSMQSAPI